MKIAAMSDLHGYLPKDVDECDVVVIAGDLVPLDVQKNLNETMAWFLYSFVYWVNELPCKKVIFTAGNHDFCFQQSSLIQKWISNDAEELIPGISEKLIFLCAPDVYGMVDVVDEFDYTFALYNYEGVRFYGEPHITGLHNMAFYTARPDVQYDTIPECDVLITHMPPKFDRLGMNDYGMNYGSKELLDCVTILRDVKLWFCGHIHTGVHGGVRLSDTLTVYNVSLKDENYKPVFPITYVDL